MLDLGRTFLQSVERSPGAQAIVDGDLRMTYGQWGPRIAHLARGLRSLGLRRGDHLMPVLTNRWELATLHWACQFASVVITPVNWRAKADEIAYCAQNAEAKWLVCESLSSEAVLSVARAQSIPAIDVDDADAAQAWFGAAAPTALGEAQALADPEDFSLMLYTSGTTGRPKGVPRRHRAERAAALAHVSQNLYERGERTLGVMPLYHTMGVRALLAMALVDGCFVAQRRFDARQALQLIERECITNLYLVPTLYHDLLAAPGFEPARVASVRKLGFAGAPMPAAVLARVEAAFAGVRIVNHYGSSEIYTFSIEPQAARKPGSAGKAGINARLRVVRLGTSDPEACTAAGEEGQIIADLRGDEAFEGYWRRSEADAKALHQGWYFTGDTGYFDAEGDLFVTGRVDDMIITGGENVSPVEVESVLSLHAAVEEVAVAGLPDERWGQKVVAFVKRRAAVDAKALDEHCRASRLMGFKRPREYVFVRAIPKSAVGKILRRKLVAGEFERDR